MYVVHNFSGLTSVDILVLQIVGMVETMVMVVIIGMEEVFLLLSAFQLPLVSFIRKSFLFYFF